MNKGKMKDNPIKKINFEIKKTLKNAKKNMKLIDINGYAVLVPTGKTFDKVQQLYAERKKFLSD